MQFKCILNRREKHRGFKFTKVEFSDGPGNEERILVRIEPRKGSKPRCSDCGRAGPGYDRLAERSFRHLAVLGFIVYFLYVPRRVDCPDCGVRVEEMPWAIGKRPVTRSLGWFLSNWAKHLSWKEVSDSFGVSWHAVYVSVEMAVSWGRQQMSLKGVRSIGVDEIYWGYKKYLTLVYQIDEGAKRLLFATVDRQEASLEAFFTWFGPLRAYRLRFVCTDMWKGYLNVLRRRCPRALNILDRYHIMAHMNKAVDEVRAEETKALRRRKKGHEAVLKHKRWCLLKRRENLTGSDWPKLREVLGANLRTTRAYLLKEQFHHFWSYRSPAWASKYIDAWCAQTMRSRLPPMKRVAKMLRRHKPLIMNWFVARNQVSLGAVEGMNNKLKANIRKSYGFRTSDALIIMLYHKLGGLPQPPGTHRLF